MKTAFFKGEKEENKTAGRKRHSLERVYYSSFAALVIVPVVVVLILSLTILSQVFRQQSLENIQRFQDTLSAELMADIEQMSIRLSHMMYVNDGEILALAAETDTRDAAERYEKHQTLIRAVSYVTGPVKEVVSVSFYMKDGLQTYYWNDIVLPQQEIRSADWYREALDNKDRVIIGSYDTNDIRLYNGGSGDSLVLVAALAPSGNIDRSQKVEMAVLFQTTDMSAHLKENNIAYERGKNRLGYTRIVDGKTGAAIYQPQGIPEEILRSEAYAKVTTPVQVFENQWILESYVRRQELTSDYRTVAGMLLMAMAVILVLYTVFSRYFLKRIILPVQQMSVGMKQVEDGNLGVHLVPDGQGEIRAMIHSFNAMVRRLRALIADYEDQMKHAQKQPSDYLRAMVRGEMSPEEVRQASNEFFGERYLIMAVYYDGREGKKGEVGNLSRRLAAGFDTVPWFASHCVLDIAEQNCFVVYYRVTEDCFKDNLYEMIRKLQQVSLAGEGVGLSVCVGWVQTECEACTAQIREVLEYRSRCQLAGEQGILDLNQETYPYSRISELATGYGKLAAALYVADEKVIGTEKERLTQFLQSETLEEGRNRVLAVILAVARQFDSADERFSDIFGQKINYYEKIGRIDEIRGLRLWISNYISWISDYSSSRLDAVETDAVIRAKRYIIENYQNPALTLKEVADYVDLSEKYFTTRFTKECGETFLSYLTGLRIQKARELIKTTTFKMYEIAEMVGYNNPEHFNRTFKKIVGMSPAQYRKTS